MGTYRWYHLDRSVYARQTEAGEIGRRKSLIYIGVAACVVRCRSAFLGATLRCSCGSFAALLRLFCGVFATRLRRFCVAFGWLPITVFGCKSFLLYAFGLNDGLFCRKNVSFCMLLFALFVNKWGEKLQFCLFLLYLCSVKAEKR